MDFCNKNCRAHTVLERSKMLEAQNFLKKKFSVSLEKDFIFQFHIFFCWFCFLLPSFIYLSIYLAMCIYIYIYINIYAYIYIYIYIYMNIYIQINYICIYIYIYYICIYIYILYIYIYIYIYHGF